MFTECDHKQFREKEISPHVVEEQLAIFRRGIPFTKLARPCTIGDGITVLTSSDLNSYAKVFHQALLSGRVTKFVPASGAASRMFKSLLAYRNVGVEHTRQEGPSGFLSETDQQACQKFFGSIRSFAFFEDLADEVSQQGFEMSNLLQARDYWPIVDSLLFSPGLDYGRLPKGLIKFHRYSQHSRTPIEEHIFEGLDYAKDSTNTARLHFTVAPEHRERVRQHLSAIRVYPDFETVSLDITCSEQKSSTETLAVDLRNQPFRGSDGKLVFRPGGHGALLENLNDLQGDIVFVKNIDNVVHDRFKDTTILYKKALGGCLINIQEQLFGFLNILLHEEPTHEHFQQMMVFARKFLSLPMPTDILHWEDKPKKGFFIQQFNRPVRVCGVVPNTGEPGGGPFWVRHQNGSLSIQIVESSQVDPDLKDQQTLWKSSTHFNPVDLVCGIKDFEGKSFDLKEYSDPDAGSIAQKSHEGRDLKALELPGLWNGAMANWNTVLVEVPPITFNPVKTVFDLLRPEHQPAEMVGKV